MGLFIQVDEGKATSVPNVFACGDTARAEGNVTLTVADDLRRARLAAFGSSWDKIL